MAGYTPPPGISQADADTRYVNVIGDTMTGDLTMAANILPDGDGTRDLGAVNDNTWANVYTRNVQADLGQELVLTRQDGTPAVRLSGSSGATILPVSIVWIDAVEAQFGTSHDVHMAWSTIQTNNAFIVGIHVGSAAQSGNIVITAAANITFDHAHAAATNPTLIVHSAAASTTQWISMSHNGANGVLAVGTGLVLIPGAARIGTTTVGGSDPGDIAAGLLAAGALNWDASNASLALFNQSGVLTHAIRCNGETNYNIAQADIDVRWETVNEPNAVLIDAGNDVMTLDVALERSTQAGITASTTQTQGQQPLTADVNEVSVVANTNDTVTLPPARAGKTVRVINNGANTMRVFPASGDDAGAGVDVATTLAAAGRLILTAYDGTTWENV